MVLIMLAGVMFPLWPTMMRVGVWYLSIAMLSLLGLFFALAIVRLIFYVITVVVASPGIWIFPQLFADVGFVRWLLSYSLNFVSDPILDRIFHSIVGVGHPEEENEEKEGRQGEERKVQQGQGEG